MHIPIKHRINTVEDLKDTPKEFGVEIDVRPYKEKLVLHHDPYVGGEDFEEFLKNYDHKLLAVNIKAEGIEKDVIGLLEKYGIKDYFLFDVSTAFTVKMMNDGVRKVACRFSEFEDVKTALNFAGKVDWVVIDNFTKLPVEDKAFHVLRKHFKLCTFSSELFGRDNLDDMKRLLSEHPVDAVITKQPERWRD